MPHSKSYLAFFSGVALTLGLAACGSQGQNPAQSPQMKAATPNPTQSVSITASGYSPDPVDVNAGGSVIWMNSDTVAHSATADDGSFDSGAIQPGAMSSPVPFASPGSFPYYDTQGSGLTGTVVVASPAPSPSASPTVSPSVSPTASPTVSPSASPTVVPTVAPTTEPTKGLGWTSGDNG